MTRRSRLVRTAAGTSDAAFGALEWSLLGATALMWGSSFMFIAIGLESLSPPVISLGRLVLGAAALAVVRRARRPLDREDLPAVALLGLFWLAIPFVLFPVAQQWVDSSIAGMINGATPIFAAVTAAVLLRRRPGPLQSGGLAVGFLGVVLITTRSVDAGDQSLLGVSLLVAAAMCYGLALNLSVPLAQKYGSLPVLLRAQGFAILAVAPFGIWGLKASDFTWAAAGAVAFLGVLSSGVALVLMTELAKRVGATRASVTIYVVPVVAVVLGATILHERVGGVALAGGLLVLVGAWLSSRRESPGVEPPRPVKGVPPGP